MTVIAVGMVLAFLVYIFRNYWWLMLKASRYGIEVDAAVSRIEKMSLLLMDTGCSEEGKL